MDNLDQDLDGLPILKKTNVSSPDIVSNDIDGLPILKKKVGTLESSPSGLPSPSQKDILNLTEFAEKLKKTPGSSAPKKITGLSDKNVPSTEGLVVPTNLPKQDVMAYESQLKTTDAAINTLTDIYKKKGLTFDPSKPAAKAQIQEYVDKEKNNDLVRVPGKDGKEYLTRAAGFWETGARTLAKSLYDPIESTEINLTNNPADLANLLDEKANREANYPEQAPSKVAGYYGGLAGGLPKMMALLSIPYVGEAAMVTDMYHNAMANQRRELYERGIRPVDQGGEGLDRETAAQMAMQTAPTAAIPDAVMGAILARTGAINKLAGGGVAEGVGKEILPAAAKKSFINAASTFGKEVGIMGGLGFGSGIGRGLIKKEAGYNVTPEELGKDALSEAGEYALMHSAFKLVHVAPKAIAAAAKNLLSYVPEPILKVEAENHPDGEETLKEVVDFANTKTKVSDFVPEEKSASVTGLTQKIDNLKLEVAELEEKKKNAPASIGIEIDNQINEKNKEINFYDSQIRKVIESKDETGIGEEMDEVTGRKLGGEPVVNPEYINAFADRIALGEKMESPEDLQFYDNNKKAIEDALVNKAKKADIEKRRKDELDDFNNTVRVQGIEVRDEKGNLINDPIEKINAKYDAELAELEKTQPTKEVKPTEVKTKERAASIEPELPEGGLRIVTETGLTEKERQAEIEKRKAGSKVSDETLERNSIIRELALLYPKNNKGKIIGARERNTSEAIRKINELKLRANKLGLSINTQTGSLIKKFTKTVLGKETTRTRKIAYDNKADSDMAIDESGKTLYDRDNKTQEVFKELTDNGHFLDFKDENGVRLSASQLDATIKDILDGIPSKRANRYLDEVEKAIKNDEFPIYDKAFGEFNPTYQDLIGLEKESVGEPMSEEEFDKYLNDEADLTPEEEEQLTDNVENLLHEYENEQPEAGIEGEIQQPEQKTEKGVPSEVKPTAKPTIKLQEEKPIVEEPQGPTTSIKNKVTAEERAEKGLSEIEVTAKRNFGDVFEKGKKMVDENEINIRKLAAYLVEKPRVLTPEESAALLYDRMKIQNEYKILSDKISKEQDTIKKDLMISELNELEQDALINDEAARKTGYEQGLGLAVRQMIIKEDYSLLNQLNKYKAANNGEELSPEVRKKLEENVAKLEIAEKKLEEYEQKIKDLQAKKTIDTEAKKTKKTNKTSEDFKKEREDIFKNIKDKWDSASKSDIVTAVPLPYSAQLAAISPEVLKLVKSYAEQGITKLDDIVNDLHDNLSKQIPQITKRDVKDILAGEYTKEREKKAPVVDREKMKLQANINKIKNQIDLEKQEIERSKRSKLRKLVDLFQGWRRTALLSGIPVLGKIGLSGALRATGTTPIESVIGGGLSKLPLISKIAEKAPREGSFSAKAEAKGFAQMVDKATYQDVRQVFKTGRGELEELHDKKLYPSQGWLDFFGQLHAAIKVVPKRAEYFRALEYRTENAIKNGKDISDPIVQQEVAAGAYSDALRTIYMQDNAVTNLYKKTRNDLEKLGGLGKVGSEIMKFILPIIKVPTNFVAEESSYILGAFKAAFALRKGISKLSPEEADYVMRALKKQGAGVGFLILGYARPDLVGGYYTGKRKKGDLEAGDLVVAGVHMPHWALHTPMLEALQFGATIRRARDAAGKSYKHKDLNMFTGVLPAIGAVGRQIPFSQQADQLSKAFSGEDAFLKYVGGQAQSVINPQLIKNIAEFTDYSNGKWNKREAKTFEEKLKAGFPGTRQELKIKK